MPAAMQRGFLHVFASNNNTLGTYCQAAGFRRILNFILQIGLKEFPQENQ
ncbi:hypothetical protein [Herbaspirillum autotrophicum]|nr:hypothetical protein [Herbaspirillum autotrophicum]